MGEPGIVVGDDAAAWIINPITMEMHPVAMSSYPRILRHPPLLVGNPWTGHARAGDAGSFSWSRQGRGADSTDSDSLPDLEPDDGTDSGGLPDLEQDSDTGSMSDDDSLPDLGPDVRGSAGGGARARLRAALFRLRGVPVGHMVEFHGASTVPAPRGDDASAETRSGEGAQEGVYAHHQSLAPPAGRLTSEPKP